MFTVDNTLFEFWGAHICHSCSWRSDPGDIHLVLREHSKRLEHKVDI